MGNGAGFMDVIRSSEFEAIWQRIVDEPVTYDEFRALPMPSGVARDELWEALSLLRRCLGDTNEIPPWFRNVGKDICWSYTPKNVEKQLLGLASLVAPHSLINLQVQARGASHPALVSNLVEEVSSAAQRDGLPLSEHVVREIWVQRRSPKNREELIIRNMRELFDRVASLAKKRYSVFLADDIHEQIVYGAEDLPLVRKLHFDVEYYDLDRVNDPEIAESALRACIKNANHAETVPQIIQSAIITANVLWDVSPWKSCNALTEFVLRCVYFSQRSVPALMYVPLSCRDTAGNAGFEKIYVGEADKTQSQGLEGTWLYAGQIRTMLEGARMLSNQIQQMESEVARVRDRIEKTPWLNRRQKKLLLALHRSSDQLVAIRAYAQANNVAYATARQDLLELEDRGLLEKETEGRTFCYRLSQRANW